MNPTKEPQMPETTLFESNNVTVTNARFVVPSQTFAISGITSVRFFTESPDKRWPIACFLIALIALGAGGNIWAALLPALLGVVLWLRRPVHHVVLTTSASETRALASKDKMFIASVINALNQAIIERS